MIARVREGVVQRIQSFCYKINSKGGFPGCAGGKRSTCQCRRYRKVGSVPGLGGSSRVRNGNPFQYFHLENPMDRGAWQAIVCGSQCRTQLKQLGTWHTSSMNFMHFMMTLENNTVNKIC